MCGVRIDRNGPVRLDADGVVVEFGCWTDADGNRIPQRTSMMTRVEAVEALVEGDEVIIDLELGLASRPFDAKRPAP